MPKDLGQRLKIANSQFNKRLGEMADSIFNSVGKEVEKHIEEYSEKITKAQKDSITLKMLVQNPQIMADHL